MEYIPKKRNIFLKCSWDLSLSAVKHRCLPSPSLAARGGNGQAGVRFTPSVTVCRLLLLFDTSNFQESACQRVWCSCSTPVSNQTVFLTQSFSSPGFGFCPFSTNCTVHPGWNRHFKIKVKHVQHHSIIHSSCMFQITSRIPGTCQTREGNCFYCFVRE